MCSRKCFHFVFYFWRARERNPKRRRAGTRTETRAGTRAWTHVLSRFRSLEFSPFPNLLVLRGRALLRERALPFCETQKQRRTENKTRLDEHRKTILAELKYLIGSLFVLYFKDKHIEDPWQGLNKITKNKRGGRIITLNGEIPFRCLQNKRPTPFLDDMKKKGRHPPGPRFQCWDIATSGLCKF